MLSQNLVQWPSKSQKTLQSLPQPSAAIELFPHQEEAIQSFSEDEVFYCPEESYFYSYCLERFVLSRCTRSTPIVEFCCGDGAPMIHSLTRNPFWGVIHAYELNSSACQVALSTVQKRGLSNKYMIYHESFFDAVRPNAEYLVANPPYLPSTDEQILMPALRGGTDGSGITCQLLSLDYPSVLLMISSYSNPEVLKDSLTQKKGGRMQYSVPKKYKN